jgi:hypothetical protein
MTKIKSRLRTELSLVSEILENIRPPPGVHDFTYRDRFPTSENALVVKRYYEIGLAITPSETNVKGKGRT